MNGHLLSARDAGVIRVLGLAGAGSQDRSDGREAVGRSRNRPKPAWGALYAVAGVAALLFWVADVESPAGGWRILTECLGTVLVIGAMALWVRANRVALALGDETSETGRPLRAWVAYYPPGMPRERLDLPESPRLLHRVVPADERREERNHDELTTAFQK